MNFIIPYMFRWKSLNRSRYFQIFTQLAKSGHTVHVVQPPIMDSADTGFIETEIAIPKNLYLHDIPMSRFFWNLKFPLGKVIKKCCYSILANKKIKQMVTQYDIDAIMLFNLPQYPLSKMGQCLTIYDIGDDIIPMLKHELGFLCNPLILGWAKGLLGRMQENCDIITAISSVLRDKTPYDSYVIPNGVNLENATAGSGKSIRQKFKTPVIGFVGSFEYYIDFDVILESASMLKDYTFLLVGGGRQYLRVKQKVQELALTNVCLTGGVSHSEIMRHIDAMDICLNSFLKNPLTHGASPIKLFEYLAFRKPVISSSLDEVKHIDEGFLYYADNAQELVAAIEAILGDPEQAASCANKGFETVKEKYTWSKVTQQLLSIINEHDKGRSAGC